MKQETIFGSKEWANETLSYAIQVLKGRKVVSLDSGRICLALYFKDLLSDLGFWWQSKTLDIWIVRAQKGDFSARQEARAYERQEARGASP